MDTVDNAITKPAHRLEVFTGAGRRRSFSDEDKARIVAEIVTSGESVSGVARRHGLSPQQLFGWRRQLRESQVGPSEADGLQFVPAVVDVASPASTDRRRGNVPRCKAEPGAGTTSEPWPENDAYFSVATDANTRRIRGLPSG
jgi:transposase